MMRPGDGRRPDLGNGMLNIVRDDNRPGGRAADGEAERARAAEEAEVARLVELAASRMRADAADLRRLLVGMVCSDVPEYARLGPSGRARISQGAERIGLPFVTSFVDDGPVSTADRNRLVAVGADRAAHGLDREAVRAGWRVAQRFAWDYVRSLTANFPQSRAGLVAAGVVHERFHERMTQMYEAVDTGLVAYQAEVTADRARAVAELVGDLLVGAGGSDEELVARARAVDHDLTVPQGLLLVGTTGPLGDSRGLSVAGAALVASLPGALGGSTHRHPLPHAVVLVPASTPAAWAEVLARAQEVAATHSVVVVPAEPVPARELNTTYRQTIPFARLAVALSFPPGVVALDCLAVYRVVERLTPLELRAVVGDAPAALLEMHPDRRQSMLDLLQVLHDSGHNVTVTAKALNLSPRGARDRLERLERRCGLSHTEPGGWQRLDLLLHVVRLAMAGS